MRGLGQRPGQPSVCSMAATGDSTCILHWSPAGGLPTHPGHVPTSLNTHQQDDAPKVGGPQQHVQIVGHLDRGIGGEAGASGAPSQVSSCPSHKQALAYLIPHQRQLQGPRLEIALHGRVKEELREGHVHHPLLLLQLGLHCLVGQAPVPLGQGKEGPLG